MKRRGSFALHDEAEIGEEDVPRVLVLASVFVGLSLRLVFSARLQRASRAEVQQEEPTTGLRALQILADVDAVVRRLAWRLAAVVSSRDEALDELVFEVRVQLRLLKIPHLRRDVLQLVRQHAGDLDVDLLDVAREKPDLLVAGHR